MGKEHVAVACQPCCALQRDSGLQLQLPCHLEAAQKELSSFSGWASCRSQTQPWGGAGGP